MILDGDDLARLRVPRVFTALPHLHLEGPKPSKLDGFPAQDRRLNLLEERIDELLRLLLGHRANSLDRLYEIGLRGLPCHVSFHGFYSRQWIIAPLWLFKRPKRLHIPIPRHPFRDLTDGVYLQRTSETIYRRPLALLSAPVSYHPTIPVQFKRFR